MQEPTQTLTEIAKNFGVLNLSQFVLSNPKFPIWSGSGREEQHHYGKGGLAKHTLEVVELCLKTNEYYGKCDPVPLFLSALFHDVGKTEDYQPIYKDGKTDYKEWESTVHKKRIHHISRSAFIWNEAYNQCAPIGINVDDVLHAILAHHQLREWGSPVMPNTAMAWLVHFCDGISARMDDVGKWDQKK